MDVSPCCIGRVTATAKDLLLKCTEGLGYRRNIA